jgi:type I restriction enzyme R subunit
MIATGTDIKPLEIVLFLRAVKSRNFFEQMKGRGVRVIDPTDFQAVTPDAASKTHFVLIDCVGVTEQEFGDSQPLERKRTVSFDKLLDAVAFGNCEADVLSSLAGRLARLDRQLGPPDRTALTEAAGGQTIGAIAAGIVDALDPDTQIAAAAPAQIAAARAELLQQAAAPLAANPALRQALVAAQQRFEQTIDTLSKDTVLEAGFSAAATERAHAIVQSFEQFIEAHRDEITALQVLYARPYGQRLRYREIKELARQIEAPPQSLTPETLWQAYAALERSKVRGAGARCTLTDIVALVRFALHQDGELVPYAEQVRERFAAWLAGQEAAGRRFTDEQRRWLAMIRDHIAANAGIEPEDFDEVPFTQHGGRGGVYRVFGDTLSPLLDELNEVLAA